MKASLETKILGVRVDNLDLSEVVAGIEGLVKTGGFHLVVTMNPEILMKTRRDKEFLKIVNQEASIVTPDGIGIILAGKLLGKPFKKRITGNDLIEPLVQLCLQNKWPVMLMGGQPGVAQKALENLKVKYLSLVGIASSHPLKSSNILYQPEALTKELLFLANLIRKAQPTVIFVAMDFGEREKFILQLIKVLKKKELRKGMVFVGIGGAMDYLAGTVKRAPKILQKIGFEWLWRLVTQPRARSIRQIKTLPSFALLVLRKAVHQRIQ